MKGEVAHAPQCACFDHAVGRVRADARVRARLADAAGARHHSAHRRRRHRHHGARGVRAGVAAGRPAVRDREPAGRRQHHRHGGGGAGGRRRLHHPRQLLDPHGVAGDALEALVQRAHRSLRRDPARQHAGGDGRPSEAGLQDARRFRGLRPQESRSTTPPPAPAIPLISTASVSVSPPSSRPCTCRSVGRPRR
jgi:hypothetical protein